MKLRHIALVLLGLVAGSIAWSVLRPKPPTKVAVTKAERVPELRAIVKATGEIRAKEFVDIQAEVPGVITELPVHEGDTVAKGDLLLKLDDLQLRADADAARAQVGAAEADAKNAEAAIATAEANLAGQRTVLAGLGVELLQAEISRDRAKASFERKQELFQTKLLGSEDYEIASAEARLAQQRYESAKARIEQGEADVHAMATRVDAAKAVHDGARNRVAAAQASLARATDLVGKTELHAPLGGLITMLQVEKGERAVPGIQSNPIATLMTIADMSVIEAEVRVPEQDVVDVTLGAKAEVEIEAIRDVKFTGVVTEMGHSPIQDATSGGGGQSQEGKEFKVVVRLDNPPANVRPGLTARAKITSATRQDVVVLPFLAQTGREVEVDAAGAYVPPPEPKPGEEQKPLSALERQRRKELDGVFVIRDGRAHFVPVKFGIVSDKQEVEVLAGLEPGAEVIWKPSAVLRTLKEWDKVELDPSLVGGDKADQGKS